MFDGFGLLFCWFVFVLCYLLSGAPCLWWFCGVCCWFVVLGGWWYELGCVFNVSLLRVFACVAVVWLLMLYCYMSFGFTIWGYGCRFKVFYFVCFVDVVTGLGVLNV